jgi:malonyl-CoA O-methyltransferase
MTNTWSQRVVERFGRSADRYDGAANLQRSMARQLAERCRRQSIPRGLWVDLGSGTGLLADDLERLHPGQTVLRVDGSDAMLRRHHPTARTCCLDLNQPLPNWSSAPVLLSSSFVLHWLTSPATFLQHWYERLAEGGWLVVAVPVAGSFQQWHQAAERAQLPCTALRFPEVDDLLNVVPRSAVRHQRLHCFSRRAQRPLELLRPMRTIGASTSAHAGLGPSQWRRIARAWPNAETPTLTWHVLSLMLQR